MHPLARLQQSRMSRSFLGNVEVDFVRDKAKTMADDDTLTYTGAQVRVLERGISDARIYSYLGGAAVGGLVTYLVTRKKGRG